MQLIIAIFVTPGPDTKALIYGSDNVQYEMLEATHPYTQSSFFTDVLISYFFVLPLPHFLARKDEIACITFLHNDVQGDYGRTCKSMQAISIAMKRKLWSEAASIADSIRVFGRYECNKNVSQ
jgi:hypothetical protein